MFSSVPNPPDITATASQKDITVSITSSSLNWTVDTYCVVMRAVSISGRPWTFELPTRTDCSDNSTKVFTRLEIYTNYAISSYVKTTGGHTSGTSMVYISTLEDSK